MHVLRSDSNENDIRSYSSWNLLRESDMETEFLHDSENYIIFDSNNSQESGLNVDGTFFEKIYDGELACQNIPQGEIWNSSNEEECDSSPPIIVDDAIDFSHFKDFNFDFTRIQAEDLGKIDFWNGASDNLIDFPLFTSLANEHIVDVSNKKENLLAQAKHFGTKTLKSEHAAEEEEIPIDVESIDAISDILKFEDATKPVDPNFIASLQQTEAEALAAQQSISLLEAHLRSPIKNAYNPALGNENSVSNTLSKYQATKIVKKLPAKTNKKIKVPKHRSKVKLMQAIPDKKSNSALITGLTLSRNKLLKLVANGSSGETIQLDHNYCSNNAQESSALQICALKDAKEKIQNGKYESPSVSDVENRSANVPKKKKVSKKTTKVKAPQLAKAKEKNTPINKAPIKKEAKVSKLNICDSKTAFIEDNIIKNTIVQDNVKKKSSKSSRKSEKIIPCDIEFMRDITSESSKRKIPRKETVMVSLLCNTSRTVLPKPIGASGLQSSSDSKTVVAEETTTNCSNIKRCNTKLGADVSTSKSSLPGARLKSSEKKQKNCVTNCVMKQDKNSPRNTISRNKEENSVNIFGSSASGHKNPASPKMNTQGKKEVKTEGLNLSKKVKVEKKTEAPCDKVPSSQTQNKGTVDIINKDSGKTEKILPVENVINNNIKLVRDSIKPSSAPGKVEKPLVKVSGQTVKKVENKSSVPAALPSSGDSVAMPVTISVSPETLSIQIKKNEFPSKHLLSSKNNSPNTLIEVGKAHIKGESNVSLKKIDVDSSTNNANETANSKIIDPADGSQKVNESENSKILSDPRIVSVTSSANDSVKEDSDCCAISTDGSKKRKLNIAEYMKRSRPRLDPDSTSQEVPWIVSPIEVAPYERFSFKTLIPSNPKDFSNKIIEIGPLVKQGPIHNKEESQEDVTKSEVLLKHIVREISSKEAKSEPKTEISYNKDLRQPLPGCSYLRKEQIEKRSSSRDNSDCTVKKSKSYRDLSSSTSASRSSRQYRRRKTPRSYRSRSSVSSSDYSSSRSRSRSRWRSSSRSRSRSGSMHRRNRSYRYRKNGHRRKSRDNGRRRSRNYSRTKKYENRRRSRERNSGRSRNYRQRCSPVSRSHRRKRSVTPLRSERPYAPLNIRSSNIMNKALEEHRVLYVGAIQDSVSRESLRKRFEAFGPIDEISLHYKGKRSDSYAFITFKYACDTTSALESGNDNRNLPRYILSYGGRRQYCKNSYTDLDTNPGYEPYRSNQEQKPYNVLLEDFQRILEGSKKI